MSLHSQNLPGIGTKYEFETDKGDTIAVFFMKTGNLQLYVLPDDCHTPYVADLTSMEAMRLGNILSGAIISSDQESVEISFSALADLRISVHTYVIKRNIAGKNIEELQIRAKTGATVIAVSRKEKNIVNPPPNFTFQEGDAVVVIGEADQLRKFEREIMVD